MQNFSVDISTSHIPQALYVKQGDSLSRFFVLTIADNGSPWEPPENAVYTIRFSTSAGSGWYDTIQLVGGSTRPAVNAAGNVLTCEVAEQATLGNGQLCVMVNDATGYQLGMWNLNIIAEVVPGANSPEAENYYGVLAGQIAQALAAAQQAETSAQSAQTSADEAAQSALVAKGHVIQNPDGTAMTQRANLQFAGAFSVVDDPSGDATIVSPISSGTQNVAGYVGEISLFADNQLRENHVWADGSTINPATWPDLAAYAATAGWETDSGTGWYKTPNLQGCFLLPSSSEYAVNTTGGEATHTLTAKEMPVHSHGITQGYVQSGSTGGFALTSYSGASGATGAAGGGQAHNNMPPYYVVTAQIRAKVDIIEATAVEVNGNTLGGFEDGQVLTQQGGKMVGQTMAYAETWSNLDANDFKGGRFYRVAYGFNITNAPTTGGVVLEFLPYTVSQSYCAQRCTSVQPSGQYKTWTRSFADTYGWSEWRELVEAYRPGDTISYGTALLAGRATTANVQVTIPLSRPCTATTAKISGRCTIRGADATTLASNVDFSATATVSENAITATIPITYGTEPTNYALVSFLATSINITLS